jgi:ribosome-binding protein aMBF1 (putative translation factor)
MGNWKHIREEILRDPEVKRIYDDLEVEYKIIDEMIILRNKKKLTQKQLAVEMKTSQSALSRFESGEIRNPSLNFLKKMAAALGTRLVVKME